MHSTEQSVGIILLSKGEWLMEFKIAAATDVGIKKKTNQDSLMVRHFQTHAGDMVLAVLCDGMGGFDKGEVASATVVKTFEKWAD